MRRLLCVPLVLLGVACTAKKLPPPETPEKVAPKLKQPPPPPSGVGRIYIDIVDGPAVIEESVSQTQVTTQQGNGTYVKTAQYNGPPIKRKLCVSPCYVDLPLGPHSLVFTTAGEKPTTDQTTLIFSETPMVYRRDLGKKERKPVWWGGVGGAVTGIAFAGIGVLVLANGGETGGFIGLGSGALLGGAGGYLMYRNRPVVQPGAENLWALNETPIEEPVVVNNPPVKEPVKKPLPLQEPPPPKDPQAEAAKVFEEAKAHYNLQEYEVALEGFKKAYLLSKEPDLLFNIGQCYRQLDRKPEAIKTFKSYLNEYPDSPLRPQVEQLLKELEAK